VVEGFLLGYDSNTRAYRVFNKSTGLVEVSCDIMCVQKNLKSLHKHKINHHLPYKHLHQLKMRKWLKKKRMKTKTTSHLKKRTLIKGEIKMIKTRKMIKRFRIKGHHTQESTKQFKEITPSTPCLVTFTRG
jgi:hypothetical protein